MSAASIDADPKDNQGGLGVTGRIPTELEQATGLEREELVELLKGVDDPFGMTMEPKAGPKGTLENPRLIPSHFSERIVGVCTDDSEMIHYFTVREGETSFVNGEYYSLLKIEGGPTPCP